MADEKRVLMQGLVFICLFTLIGHLEVEAKGRGRGGSFGSRSRSRSGSGIRRIGSGFSGGRQSWYTKAIYAGALYGMVSYKTRRRWKVNREHEPTICKNFVAPNGTHYGYFICPMYHQPDSYDYCCGPEWGQKCCRFEDDAGRIAGAVIGAIVGFVVLALIIWCCCCRGKTTKPGKVLQPQRTKAPPVVDSDTAVGYTASPNATDGPPSESGKMPYPAQPYPAQPDPVQPYPAEPYPPAAADGPPPYAAHGQFPSDGPTDLSTGGYPPGSGPMYPPAPYPPTDSSTPYPPNPPRGDTGYPPNYGIQTTGDGGAHNLPYPANPGQPYPPGSSTT